MSAPVEKESIQASVPPSTQPETPVEKVAVPAETSVKESDNKTKRKTTEKQIAALEKGRKIRETNIKQRHAAKLTELMKDVKELPPAEKQEASKQGVSGTKRKRTDPKTVRRLARLLEQESSDEDDEKSIEQEEESPEESSEESEVEAPPPKDKRVILATQSNLSKPTIAVRPYIPRPRITFG